MRRATIAVAAAAALGIAGWLTLGGPPPSSAQDAAPGVPQPERTVTRFSPAPSQGRAHPAPPGTASPASDPSGAPRPRVSPDDAPAPASPRCVQSRRGEGWVTVCAPEDTDASADTDAVRYSLDPEGIKAAMADQREELRACYDTLLASYPDLEGRLVAAFEIDALGVVTSADIVDATFDSIYLEGCVVTALEDVRFEAADGGGSVHWPLVFRPR